MLPLLYIKSLKWYKTLRIQLVLPACPPRCHFPIFLLQRSQRPEVCACHSRAWLPVFTYMWIYEPCVSLWILGFVQYALIPRIYFCALSFHLAFCVKCVQVDVCSSNAFIFAVWHSGMYHSVFIVCQWKFWLFPHFAIKYRWCVSSCA